MEKSLIEKYDLIGTNYNHTRNADPYLVKRFLHYLNPKISGLYLDIGCGTGNYTIELQKNGGRFIGVDPSKRMLVVAASRTNKIDWILGSCEKTGLTSDSIDGTVASLTIHHWKNLVSGFQEMSRILRKEGIMVIFTSSPEQMKGYWLNHYFPSMLLDSISQMPTIEKVKNALVKSNIEIVEIEKYFVKPDLQDGFLYCGKQNPALYLDPGIRNGISSFSSLANKVEVKAGLERLKRDIETNEIREIIKSYNNNLGDYAFVVGKKKAAKNCEKWSYG